MCEAQEWNLAQPKIIAQAISSQEGKPWTAERKAGTNLRTVEQSSFPL